jgi:hypothetical protein
MVVHLGVEIYYIGALLALDDRSYKLFEKALDST